MKFKKLTPNMMVNDVQESVKFYTDILGFTLDMVVPENSETIETELKDSMNYVYAMVSRDEIFIMFMKRDVFEKDLPMLKGTAIGASASFYIEVEDVEGLYQEMKSKADIAIELKTVWYGMKEFYIKDCNGYILGFAERK